MKTFADANMTLGDVLARYARYVDTHAERGCGGDQVAVLTSPRGHRFLVGVCRCACPDHPCRAEEPAPGPDCPTCGDSGYLRRRRALHDPGFGRVEPCPDCHAPGSPRSIARLYARSGLTEAHRRLTLAALDGGVPREPIRGWVRAGHQERPFLVLSGQRGTGKTHGAVGAVQALIADGVEAMYLTAAGYLEALKATYGDPDAPPGAEARVARTYATVPALALDDLDAEQETEWSRARLFALINERWEQRRLTIVTTNVTPRAMPDDRTWSRVFGTRYALVITLAGRDRRFEE